MVYPPRLWPVHLRIAALRRAASVYIERSRDMGSSDARGDQLGGCADHVRAGVIRATIETGFYGRSPSPSPQYPALNSISIQAARREQAKTALSSSRKTGATPMFCLQWKSIGRLPTIGRVLSICWRCQRLKKSILIMSFHGWGMSSPNRQTFPKALNFWHKG